MKNKQMIYYGPPGTGKTYQVKEEAIKYLAGKVEPKVNEREVLTHENFDETDLIQKFSKFYENNSYLLQNPKYKPGKKPYRNLRTINLIMKLFIIEETTSLEKGYIISTMGWEGPSSYVQRERTFTNFDLSEEDWKETSRNTLTLNDNGKELKQSYIDYLERNDINLEELTNEDSSVLSGDELPQFVKEYIKQNLAETTIESMTLWKNIIICSLRFILEEGYIYTYRKNTEHSTLEKEKLIKYFNYNSEDTSFLSWIVAYLDDLDLIIKSEDNTPDIQKFYLNEEGIKLISRLEILGEIEEGANQQMYQTPQQEENRYIIDQAHFKKRAEINKDYDRYKNLGIIDMVTFHPSYEYEDFLEGISVKNNKGSLEYFYKTGIFKAFCTNALKNVLEVNLENLISDEEEISKEKQKIEELDWEMAFKSYKRYKEKIEWEKASNFIFIIDEINRGDISKIFGESITLLESDKRLGNNNELIVKLPFTQEEFSIPKNIIILCTMNTSDRSIGSFDIALRRRFNFVPKYPDLSIVEKLYHKLPEDKEEETNLLTKSVIAIEVINQKINEVTFIGRDKLIGHSFLMIDDTFTDQDIINTWRYDIYPLLEEYFLGEFDTMIETFGLDDSDYTFIDLHKGFNKEDKNIIGFIDFMGEEHE